MEKKHARKINKENALYICTALFLPNIFVFLLYNNNRVMNDLYLSHFAVLGVVLAAVSLGVFLFFRWIARSSEGALLVLLLSWASFWLFEEIYSGTGMAAATPSRLPLLGCILVVVVIVLWCLRRFSPPFHKAPAVFRTIAIMICVLFVYNFVPAVYANTIATTEESSRDIFELKTSFVVDEELPSPDIYWLHMDGMMSIDTTEKYFGGEHDWLRSELESRGFSLNEDAVLDAGYSEVAVPALLSPTFYDSYLGRHLAEVNDLLRYERQKEMERRLLIDGVNLKNDIQTTLEAYRAFVAAGYTGITIADYGKYFRPIDRFYRLNNDEKVLTINDENEKTHIQGVVNDLGDFIELITSASAFSLVRKQVLKYADEADGRSWATIPDYEDSINRLTEETYGISLEKKIYRRLLDSFSIESPKFVLLCNYIPHAPFDKIYETEKIENPSPDEPEAVELLYLPQYDYAARVMLITIDMILEQNPDAVIILQGDHGIHKRSTQTYMTKKGYSVPEMLEMEHSVFSAIRIPEKYDIFNEPVESEPLNISRVLVNSFVGENYELLE